MVPSEQKDSSVLLSSQFLTLLFFSFLADRSRLFFQAVFLSGRKVLLKKKKGMKDASKFLERSVLEGGEKGKGWLKMGPEAH